MPGTTSKCTAVRATACTSLTTDSWPNGSPDTRCTADRPDLAADSSTLATSPGCPSAGLNWASSLASALIADSSESDTPRSYTTWSAPVRASWARRVSNPGSPGPAPTNAMRPTGLRAVRAVILSLPYACTPGPRLRGRRMVRRLRGRRMVRPSAARCGRSCTTPHQGVGAGAEEVGGECLADLRRVGGRSGARQPDGSGPIRADHGTAQVDLVAVLTFGERGVCRDRGGAPGLERGEHRPLRQDGGAGRCMIECGQQLDQVGVAGPALHRQRTLGRGGQHEHRVQRFGDLGGPAETGHAGPGENHRVEVG